MSIARTILAVTLCLVLAGCGGFLLVNIFTDQGVALSMQIYLALLSLLCIGSGVLGIALALYIDPMWKRRQ